ncbi:MAG: glycosyltransferase family 39 protein [Bacteroidetes bacterium]|nr:glycosyltransferase family 39 protein [Bacteroidota bacterium]
MERTSTIHIYLAVLIILSAAVRAFIAGFVELGNDEVYYWTYALYPALSHFDHPPMIGWVIQLFTLNLTFSGEFFLRLPSIVFGAINTWLIYLIGSRLKNQMTGLYAAFFYTGSIYCFVITGILILPDTPQLFFWLISLFLLLDILKKQDFLPSDRVKMILAGASIGLALLSKYTSAFLWAGALLYILFFNRKWLRTKELYLAVLLSALIFLPVIIWNVQNDFISFTYHSSRVDMTHSGFRPVFLATELLGQFFYNNPVNVIVIILSLWAVLKHRNFIEKEHKSALLLFSLPLIGMFLVFAMFRRTLPHWSGPGYLSLILLASAWLDDRLNASGVIKLFPLWNKISIVLMILILTIGILQIRYGLVNSHRLRFNDPSLEMYGWKQLEKHFIPIYDRDIKDGRMKKDAVIISPKWFPAAHLDYYLAYPNHINLFAVNTLEEIHKYAWINKARGGLQTGTDAYYITPDNYFRNPADLYKGMFEIIEEPDTITIYRGKIKLKEVYVYRMKNLKDPGDF